MEGKDPKTGRFVKGEWKGGPGRPASRRREELEKVLKACITPEDMATLWKLQLEKALKGNEFSTKLLLEYAYGKPTTYIEVTTDEPLFDVRSTLHAITAGINDESRLPQSATSGNPGEGSTNIITNQQVQPSNN